jgi:hypothetical protein
LLMRSEHSLMLLNREKERRREGFIEYSLVGELNTFVSCPFDSIIDMYQCTPPAKMY